MKSCCDRINVKEYPVQFRKILRMTSRSVIFILPPSDRRRGEKVAVTLFIRQQFKEV